MTAYALVIENKPDDVAETLECIRRAGCESIVEAKPQQAYELLRQKRFDLVIVDVSFPNGLQLCSDIRELLGERPVIIVLSEVGKRSFSVVALQLGADDFVEKPFNPSELQARIESSLRRHVAAW